MIDDDSEEDTFDFKSSNNYEQKHAQEKAIISNEQSEKVLSQITDSFFSMLEKKNDFHHQESWKTYSNLEPIKIKIDTTETLPGVCDIIESKNIFINKVLIAFSSLIIEVENTLPNDFETLYPLSMYESSSLQNDMMENGAVQMQIGSMMSYFGELFNKVTKLLTIGINMFNQLVSLYSKDNPHYKHTYSTFVFESMFDSLGKIFSFFVAIDSIVSLNGKLNDHWEKYSIMFSSIRDNKAKYGMTEEQYKRLDRLIKRINSSIFSKNCFKQCVNNFLKQTGEIIPSGNGFKATLDNKVFMECFTNYLKDKIKKVTEQIGTFTETNEKMQLFHLIALFGIYCNLMGPKSDKGLYQSFWAIQNKLSTINIIGNSHFRIEVFMGDIKPHWSSSVSLDPKNVPKKIASRLSKLDEGMPAFIANMRMQIMTWITRMESDLFSIKGDGITEQIDTIIHKSTTRIKTIILGLSIANRLKSNILFLLETHLNDGIDITTELITNITTGLELIKVIENEFERAIPAIAIGINLINRAYLYPLKTPFDGVLKKCQAKLKEKSSNKEYYADVIEALRIIINNMSAVPSPMRMIISRLCLEVLSHKNILEPRELDRIQMEFWKLDKVNHLTAEIKSACDCSFFYWYTEFLLKICVDSISKSNPQRIYFFARVLNDTESPLHHVLYLEDHNKMIFNHRKKIQGFIQEEFLTEIAKKIEIDLRVEIHSMLISKLKTPDKTDINLAVFLSIRPFLLFDIIIDTKRFVEQYLNKMFYDMTTLNLNDWKTYQKMRVLAKSKYTIDLHDIFLPSQTLEQGRDLLDLSRHIKVFSRENVHNLHSQMFIQKTNDSTSINVLGVKQILNSLYTHGTGIINTIVNKFYKLLGTLATEVIQFLHGEEIMSLLKNEENFWNDQKVKNNYHYPYEHAEKMLKMINEIDSKRNPSQMDEIRSKITQIGNVVGLVRCIRSALMEYNSHNIKFLQTDYEQINDMVQKIVIDNEGLTEQISPSMLANTGNSFNASNKILSDTISILKQTGLNDLNYLSLLVTTFDHAFSQQNSNLSIFSYLVPALSINFVDNLLGSKMKIMNKNNTDGYFTDDGFIIGICYLVKIFDIDESFDSLNWFDSILKKFKADSKELKTKKLDNKEFNKNMAMMRTQDYQFEFEMLAYTYSSAIVLFNE